MSKRSIKVAFIKFLTFLMIATPFIFIKPPKAAAIQTGYYLTPGVSDLTISGINIETNQPHDTFGEHVDVSWTTNPSEIDPVSYKVVSWTSTDGVTWTPSDGRVLVSPSDYVDEIIPVDDITPVIPGCLTADYYSYQKYKPIPTAQIDTNCEGDPTKDPYSALDYSGSTIHFRDRKYSNTSQLYQTTTTFYVWYDIMSFYKPNWYNKLRSGPIISVMLSTGPNATLTETQLIQQIQNKYDYVISEARSMFATGNLIIGQYWTDQKGSWLTNLAADTAQWTARNFLEYIKAPKIFVDSLDSGFNLYPTQVGWNKLNSIQRESTHALKLLEKLETLMAGDDNLDIDFKIVDINTGTQTSQTQSFSQMKTDVQTKLAAIDTIVDEQVPDDGSATGVCMGSEGLNIGGGEINIIAYIACLIDEVAKGILALAIEWMQAFAGI